MYKKYSFDNSAPQGVSLNTRFPFSLIINNLIIYRRFFYFSSELARSCGARDSLRICYGGLSRLSARFCTKTSVWTF